MGIVIQRVHGADGLAALKISLLTFAQFPTKVDTGLTGWHHVDFFVGVLADVGNPYVSGAAVDADTPRVAQTVRPHFPSGSAGGFLTRNGGGAGFGHEGVVGGNAVRLAVSAGIDINTQHLAQQHAGALGVVVGVPGTASVTNGYQQFSRRIEHDAAGVVLIERFGDRHQYSLLRRVRPSAVERKLADGDVALEVGVVDEQSGGVVRIERQPQQSPLVFTRDLLHDVEYWCGIDDPRPQRTYATGFVGQEQRVVVWSRRQRNGLAHGGDGGELHLDAGERQRGAGGGHFAVGTRHRRATTGRCSGGGARLQLR